MAGATRLKELFAGRDDGVTAELRMVRVSLALIAAILIFAALSAAQVIMAPVAFSLFVIAVAWPLQRFLQARIPKLVALVVTVVVILAVLGVFGSLLLWALGRIAQWLLGNGGKLQLIYGQATAWLEGHGISVAAQIATAFDVGWVIRAAQQIGTRLQSLGSFVFIAFIFTMLGLLEVDVARRNVARLGNEAVARSLLHSGESIAAKFQKFMLVRTVMSVLTGAMIFLVTLLAGLELATAWGVIAFVLNYVPFMGPLVATVFPTLFAVVQFESWELALVIFLCLNVVQFVIGSYLEPRIAGAALSISPFLILFAVFFWSYLWGIPGAFIGVPIVIGAVTVCEQHESTRWIAALVSGPVGAEQQEGA